MLVFSSKRLVMRRKGGDSHGKREGKQVFSLGPRHPDPRLLCDPDLQPGCHGACLLLAEVHDFFHL